MSDKTPVFICDLDGTLADFKTKGTRSPYEYNKLAHDEVIENVAWLVRFLREAGLAVLYVTGRPQEHKEQTAEWLFSHDLPFGYIFARANNDKRPDDVVKREIYQQKIDPYFEVKFVLDDRNKVVKMWREQGLTCLQVANGDF